MSEVEGRIYKLYIAGMDEMDDVCYIGSTTRTLEYRRDLHKHQALSPSQNKCAATPLYEDGNEVLIVLLEESTFESVRQMEERERYWIEQHPNCTNKNIPTRGWKERWLAKREHHIQKHKEWVAANQEHIAAYNAANRERTKAQEKARYDAGYKEKRSEAKKAKVACEVCGKEMNKNSLWTHKKTVHVSPTVTLTSSP